jgi:hypothetical protein
MISGVITGPPPVRRSLTASTFGELSLADGTYHGWETLEEAAAEAAANEQFPIWVTETFGPELLADGHTSCYVWENDMVECSGNLADGRSIEATAPLPSDGLSFEFTSAFRDAPEFETPLAKAVYACSTLDEDEEVILDANGELVADDGDFYFHADELSFDDYAVLDRGHSVDLTEADDVEALRCLHKYLGLPEWLSAQVVHSADYDVPVWTTVTVGGYTITWMDDVVIIYDEVVA